MLEIMPCKWTDAPIEESKDLEGHDEDSKWNNARIEDPTEVVRCGDSHAL